MSIESNFMCEICLQLCSNNFQLFCSHIFCKDCLKSYILEKIKIRHVNSSSLICPESKCKTSLNYYDIKELLPVTEFEKYDFFLMEICEPTNKEDKKFSCPKCNNVQFIPISNISFVKCTKCLKTWCTNENCMGDWSDHALLECEQYKEKFKDKTNQEKYQEFIKKEGLKPCPYCGVIVEKIKNCNYVRCSSMKCQQKNVFCYLCGIKLKENEISSHYQNNNYYKSCKDNTLKIEENERLKQNINQNEEKVKDEISFKEEKIINLNIVHDNNSYYQKNIKIIDELNLYNDPESLQINHQLKKKNKKKLNINDSEKNKKKYEINCCCIF